MEGTSPWWPEQRRGPGALNGRLQALAALIVPAGEQGGWRGTRAPTPPQPGLIECFMLRCAAVENYRLSKAFGLSLMGGAPRNGGASQSS